MSFFFLNLVSFSKLNDFTINFITKEVALITFSSPELTFLKIPPSTRFSFGSITQKENGEAAEISRFSIDSGDFCQTERSVIILVLEAQNEYQVDVFLPKQDSFQDSSINHLRSLNKSLRSDILERSSKLNEFTIDLSQNKWLRLFFFLLKSFSLFPLFLLFFTHLQKFLSNLNI